MGTLLFGQLLVPFLLTLKIRGVAGCRWGAEPPNLSYISKLPITIHVECVALIERK